MKLNNITKYFGNAATAIVEIFGGSKYDPWNTEIVRPEKTATPGAEYFIIRTTEKGRISLSIGTNAVYAHTFGAGCAVLARPKELLLAHVSKEEVINHLDKSFINDPSIPAPHLARYLEWRETAIAPQPEQAPAPTVL